jgi:hypothetical protein
MGFAFYLGTHKPQWLWQYPGRRYFISDVQLRTRKGFRGRAAAPWALDSGGYTELNKYGRWTISDVDYAKRINRYAESLGHLLWAAPQDWMCSHEVLARTGLSVADHQRFTIESVKRLRQLTSVQVIPVLQGAEPDDYRRHVDLYEAAGFSLANEPVVGVGSIVKRQRDGGIHALIRELAGCGLHLHAFGYKTLGLRAVWESLRSADSMAWSMAAKNSRIRHPLCANAGHQTCANCFNYAKQWFDDMKADVGFVEQV